MFCPKTASRAGLWFAIAVGITAASIVSSQQSAERRAAAQRTPAIAAIAAPAR